MTASEWTVQTCKGSEKLMGKRFDSQMKSGPKSKFIKSVYYWSKLGGHSPAHTPLSGCSTSTGGFPSYMPSPLRSPIWFFTFLLPRKDIPWHRCQNQCAGCPVPGHPSSLYLLSRSQVLTRVWLTTESFRDTEQVNNVAQLFREDFFLRKRLITKPKQGSQQNFNSTQQISVYNLSTLHLHKRLYSIQGPWQAHLQVDSNAGCPQSDISRFQGTVITTQKSQKTQTQL